MIAVRLEKTCPKCGSHLMIKEGDRGDFLACPRFPACRYTESIRNEDKLELRKLHNPYCTKCNHSGLLPLIKNGQIIPHAWVNCECKQDEPDHYQPIRPEDFDFPMSATFRAASFEFCGQRDPAYSPPELDITAIEDRLNVLENKITMPGAVPRKYEHQLEQVKGELLRLQSRLNEHTKPQERPKKPTGYKGIK